MIIVFTEPGEFAALARQLARAGWDDASDPGRQLAYNGLLHALGSYQRGETPAVRAAVLYAPGAPAGVAGVLTYRDWADCLEVEYLGVAVPGQGTGTALMRWVAGRAATRGVPVAVTAYATATRFYRRLGMHESPPAPGRPLATFTWDPEAATVFAQAAPAAEPAAA